jgi:AraC-like DNA-binding protein
MAYILTQAGYCPDVTAVKRYEYEHGWMEVASRPPHPALASHVTRYWGFAETSASPVRRREIPGQDVVAILGFGPPMHVDDAPRATFVAGLTETSVVTAHEGVSHGLEVTFTPLGARMVLGIPMHLLANEVVPFEDVWGEGASELLERLYETPDWEARFALLDAVLATRLAEAAPSPAAVAWAWRRLVAEAGQVAVRELAAELSCSRRYLATQFREHVGLTPKSMARILRFQHAVRLLERDGERQLDRIALACGYYDQPHFNRDFRAFAGSTPTEFLARLFPSAPGLAPD